jgi:hypothetical protein
MVVAVPGAVRLTRCRGGRSLGTPDSGRPDRQRKPTIPSPAPVGRGHRGRRGSDLLSFFVIQ